MSDDSTTPPVAVITTDYQRGASVLRCAGELDMTSAPELHEAADLLLAHRPPALVIDLTDVRFLGSAAISALVATQQNADRDGITLAVVATSRAVLRPLEATHIDQVLALYATVDEAVDSATLSPAPRGNGIEENADHADTDR